jgi:UDP-2,4-diacetamido-2,4,6-trideoxy-beta-L-altropyranose hydrolase
MQIAFRTDASLDIGTGHVMRCLTLAEALRDHGAHCRFICRSHPGNLIREIRQRGFDVFELPFERTWTGTEATQLVHAAWLGADWKLDAEQTKVGAGETVIDWLIVDHYALDVHWEHALAPSYRKLMVIDDLADRRHACDLLLDQTFGREAADYHPLVPTDCCLLCGSQYALLRPEFAALRAYSRQRRSRPALRELLITMGGVDKGNATGQVLQALRICHLPADTRITVVMGATAPWLDEIRTEAQDMPWPTRVLVGVSDMAKLMADSDLAIGAAGTTSWERCCLGLPTIMFVLAANQGKIAEALCKAGAAHMADALKLTYYPLVTPEYLTPLSLSAMSRAAAAITDGLGVAQVTETLTNKVEHANQLAV